MQLEKITERGAEAGATRGRRYADACATAHAMDLLGERWAMLVVRELMFGPKRFGDLRAGLPGISANVLTQRLDGLEAAGVVIRTRLAPPASVPVYALTEWGREAEPIFRELGRWAARSPLHDPTLPFSASSLLLSMTTMLDPARADGLTLDIGLRLGAERFAGRLAQGRIAFRRSEPERADLVLSGAPPVVAALLYGGQRLADLEAAGALTVTGDRALAERFAGLFPLPDKATSPASGPGSGDAVVP